MSSEITIRPVDEFNDLHRAAEGITGLSNFGDQTYHRALRILLEAYSLDENLSASGWQRCRESIIGGLVGRLLSEQRWADQPEVLEASVRAPIIIAGLPRTGTTILYKLLSLDPELQKLEFWLGNTPMVRPPREQWESYPEYQATVAFVDKFYEDLPEFRKIHDMAADEPEEDRALLIQDFTHLWFMESAHMPTYDDFVVNAKPDVAFCRFRDNLKLIGSNEPHKRWVLKDPPHLMHMDTLLKTFPDACIIQTHRDPAKSLPSLCSLTSQFRSLMEGPDPDPLLIGPRQLHIWQKALETTMTEREKNPRRFLDIHFSEVLKDPVSVVEKIYAFCDLTMTNELRDVISDWISKNQQGKHGVHHYSLTDYGLDKTEVHRAFASYMNKYNVQEE